MEKEAFVSYQNALLQKAMSSDLGPLVSRRVVDAFMRCPRHEFVGRVFDGDLNQWVESGVEKSPEVLPFLYEDKPLIIARDESTGAPISTISQPSFVLHLLQMLDLRPGQTIFELGTGSGWNAAMMAEIVGDQGRVITVEIVADLALEASHRLKTWPQVTVLHGDGTAPELGDERFDRVIFTAGSYDVPRFVFDRVREGGRLLFVLRSQQGPDLMYLLEKRGGHFESLRSALCRFVGLSDDAGEPDDFFQQISPETLVQGEWSLDVYSSDESLKAGAGQWLSKRKNSQFLWTNRGESGAFQP